MGNTTHMETEARPASDARDARQEPAALRRELAKYREVFDSAKLIVGHEFAKPLTAISGYLDLLEERIGAAAGERERAYFAKMRGSLGRLEDLVEFFIEMLRVENGTWPARDLERVAVGDLIARVRERFDERAAFVSIRIDGEMPPVLLPRRCVEVVVENLLSNALKHGDGTSPVTVTASLARDRNGSLKEDTLVVTVEDHGAGIPESKLEDIFTPFVRLDNGQRADGLGLGLPLVKSIVAILRGEIRVESEEGKGTTISVAVPVANDTSMLPDTVG